MKRLLAWLLILVMCFTLAACQGDDATNSGSKKDSAETTAAEPESKGATPLLYSVTDEDGNVIWLFGSIHVGRDDFYPLPDYVIDAFDQADSLAVEADIIAFEKSMSQQMEALSHMIYTDGSTIKDHISEELYNQAVAALKEHGSYSQFYDSYCPSFWANLIDSLLYNELGVDISLGIDRHLLERAKDAEKEVLEVESAEFQYRIMSEFSNELQVLLLEESVASCQEGDEVREELDALMDLWASGDEEAFATYLADDDEDITAEQAELYEEYMQVMFTRRNISMARYAEDALRSGKEVFICVGAAHIVGKGAVAELLEKRGYSVECITQ